MLSTDFSTNRTPNFIQNTDILITLGNTSAENKGFECTSLTITSKIGFQTILLHQTLVQLRVLQLLSRALSPFQKLVRYSWRLIYSLRTTCV